ncbi:MAG: PHP domain-containing protein, partial [Candidatus Jordarchaeales archaeon]
MSIIDMHVHTEFSPCSRVKLIESLSKAAQLGVGLAITDHDTIKGALKAKSFSQKYEVKIFIGCEVSTKDGQVLAYGIME